MYNCARSFAEPKHNNNHFSMLNLGDFVKFPCGDSIFDNDFIPKNHWRMLTALPDPNINPRPFVYIQMGALAATSVFGLTSGSIFQGNISQLAQLLTIVGRAT